MSVPTVECGGASNMSMSSCWVCFDGLSNDPEGLDGDDRLDGVFESSLLPVDSVAQRYIEVRNLNRSGGQAWTPHTAFLGCPSVCQRVPYPLRVADRLNSGRTKQRKEDLGR